MNQSILSPKKYAAAVLAFGAACLALIGAFNFVIDPYAMFRSFERPGLNVYKPAIYNRVRLLKAYEVRKARPDSILLGSSRAHLAFRPSHPGWAKAADRRYNLAFDGATTKEMYYYLRHAQAVHPLKQVLLCLDSYHPTKAPGASRPGFDRELLLSDSKPFSRLRLALEDLKLLTSFDTFLASAKTMEAQKTNEPVWLAPDGQRLGEAFFRRPYENFVTFGPRYYFDEIDKMEVGYKLEWKIPPQPGKKSYHAPESSADPVTSLDYIAKMVDFCRQNGIELVVFFSPSHAHQLEIAAATGGWNDFENAKRNVVKLLAEDAQRYPDRPRIPLYDFSGYSTVTTEPLPAEKHAEMKYYWDSSHFKERVGDMVLDRIFGTQTGAGAPEGFGPQLTEQNIEGQLEKDRMQQARYRETYPDDIQQIHTLVKNFKKEHSIPDEPEPQGEAARSSAATGVRIAGKTPSSTIPLKSSRL